jgi:hypothetical protein
VTEPQASEYQVTRWRDLPSMVVARSGAEQAKASLPQRFQDAIDEAAMRLGETSSEAYLEGWRRDDWAPGLGPPARLAADVVEELDREWPPDALAAYLDSLSGPGTPS